MVTRSNRSTKTIGEWLSRRKGLCLMLILLFVVSSTSAAPRNHHHKRRQQPDWEFHERPDREWVSPCGVVEHLPTAADDNSIASSSSSLLHSSTTPSTPLLSGGGGGRNVNYRQRKERSLNKIREFLLPKIGDMSTRTAIDTHHISEWFSKNTTYDFLERINASNHKISLRNWHVQTQVYIGALQNLMTKQRHLDTIKNEDNKKTKELGFMMRIATTLLCEINTAMRKLDIPLPKDLTRENMDKRLTFSSTEVDTLDMQFTKVRFIEFLHGMEEVLLRKKQQQRMRRKNLKRRRGGKNKKTHAKSNAAESRMDVPTAAAAKGSRKVIRMDDNENVPVKPPTVGQNLNGTLVTDEQRQDDLKRRRHKAEKERRARMERRARRQRLSKQPKALPATA